MNDENAIKHTAVKVDVTSVRSSSSSRRRHNDKTVVVVISRVTSSREVVAMVVQRIGQDAKLAAKMQLVSDIVVRNGAVKGQSGSMELILSNDDCPLNVFDLYQKHNVRFRLKWRPDCDVIEPSERVLNERNTNQQLVEKPRDMTSCSQRQPSSNGSVGLPPRADVASSLSNLGGPTGSERGLTSLPKSKSIDGNNVDVGRRISLDSSSTVNGLTSTSSLTRHSSLSNKSGANIYSMGVGRVQNVFPVEDLQTPQFLSGRENVNVAEVNPKSRSMSVERNGGNRKHCDQPTGRLGHDGEQYAGGRRHSVDDSRASMFTSSIPTSKTIVGGGTTGGRRYEQRLLTQQTNVSTAFRAYSNLAVACSDDDDDDDALNANGNGRDGGRQANDGEFDGEEVDGRRSVDCKSENRSTTSSMAGDEERLRSLVKFSSLPNIDQLRPGGPLRRLLGDYSPVDDGHRHRRRRRHRRENAERSHGVGRQERRSTMAESAVGSDGIGCSDGVSSMSSGSLKSSATSSSRVATDVDVSTGNRRRDDPVVGDRSYALMAESMPCISSAFGSAGRGGRTPKRFLPSLSITEEDVEQKRSTLTRQLSLRLLTAVNKHRHRHKHGGEPTGSATKSEAPEVVAVVDAESSSTTCVRLRAPKRRGSKKVKRRHQGYATSTGPKDDDVMSVTSREVAEILSMAAPMAPLSDEEEEQEQEEDSRVDLDDEDDDYYNNNNNHNSGDDDEEASSGRRACTTSSSHSDTYAHHDVSSAFQRLAVDGGAQQYRSRDEALFADQPVDRPWVGARPLSIQRLNSDTRNGNASMQPTGGDESGRMNANGDDMDRSKNDRRELNSSTSGNGSGRAPGTTTAAAGAAVASLFRLIRTCRLGAFRLERCRGQRGRSDNDDRQQKILSSSPPFHVVNDVALLADDVIDINGLRRPSTAAPTSVVTVTEVTWSDWSVSSSGGEVLPGDIVIEVNGQLVLGQTAHTVNSMLLSAHRSMTSSVLDLVIARRHHSSKVVDSNGGVRR